jgi:hypothetical protein
MRNSILILLTLPFLIQSCVVEPKIPNINLTVKNESGVNVDSVCVFSDSTSAYGFQSECYHSEELSHNIKVYFRNTEFRIQVYLANKTVLSSNTLYRDKDLEGFTVKVTNKNLQIEKSNNFILMKYFKIFVYLLFISYFFKVIVYVLILKPKRIWMYSSKYTILNVCYLGLLILLGQYLIHANEYLPLFVGFIVSSSCDYLFHRMESNIQAKNFVKTILITNSLFYTIGIILLMIVYSFCIQ